MKGAADFMLDWIIENPKKPGELITAPCTSPEAEYITDKGYQGCSFYGGTADLTILRELFKKHTQRCSDSRYRSSISGKVTGCYQSSAPLSDRKAR